MRIAPPSESSTSGARATRSFVSGSSPWRSFAAASECDDEQRVRKGRRPAGVPGMLVRQHDERDPLALDLELSQRSEEIPL